MIVARRNVWLAAAVPPLLWMAQGSIGWFIASHACPHATEPLSLGRARLAIALITLVTLAATVASLVYARRNVLVPDDASNEPKALSTAEHRARFVAVLALFVSVTLTLGLILAGMPSLMLSACGETR